MNVIFLFWVFCATTQLLLFASASDSEQRFQADSNSNTIDKSAGNDQILEKRYTETEGRAFAAIKEDPALEGITPKYLGVVEENGVKKFNRMQNLLTAFKKESMKMMDIKLGKRSYLQSELANTTARTELFGDLFKFVSEAQAKGELTAEELASKAITKARYMHLRDKFSSTASLGFRIQGGGNLGLDEYKSVQRPNKIGSLLAGFLGKNVNLLRPKLLQRLRQIRSAVEKSTFFRTHEVVDSSVLVVHDDHQVGAWLIDFGKSVPLSEGVQLDHRKEWDHGNHEDGYLSGLDALITMLQRIEDETQAGTQMCRKWRERDSTTCLSALVSCFAGLFSLDTKSSKPSEAEQSVRVIREGLIESICAQIERPEMHLNGLKNWQRNASKEVQFQDDRMSRFSSYAMEELAELAHTWNSSPLELLESLTGADLVVIKNPNGRQSNEDVFLRSGDAKFFIKDVKNAKRETFFQSKPRSEIDFFTNHFEHYYGRMTDPQDEGRSLLPRYYALFSVTEQHYITDERGIAKPLSSEHFYLATSSLFPAEMEFAYKFDLKGSLDHQKVPEQKAKDPSATLRLLNLVDEAHGEGLFREGILLADEDYERFMGQLERDAEFLHESRLTDYSLLVGVSFGQLTHEQETQFKSKYPNLLGASCRNCSMDRGLSYRAEVGHFLVVPGIIDILTQFNWRKTIDLVKQVVVAKKTKKADKSAIGPSDYFPRFMCAMATKVFRPTKEVSKADVFKNKYCLLEMQEPNVAELERPKEVRRKLYGVIDAAVKAAKSDDPAKAIEDNLSAVEGHEN